MKSFFWIMVVQMLTITWINGQQEPRSLVNNPFNLQEAAQHRHLPQRLAFNENGPNNKEDKALVDRVLKVALAVLYARLTYIAEFPTAATSYNISDQCKTDSRTYYDSYTGLQNWALRSIKNSNFDKLFSTITNF